MGTANAPEVESLRRGRRVRPLPIGGSSSWSTTKQRQSPRASLRGRLEDRTRLGCSVADAEMTDLSRPMHERYDQDEARLLASASDELWTSELLDATVDVAAPMNGCVCVGWLARRRTTENGRALHGCQHALSDDPASLPYDRTDDSRRLWDRRACQRPPSVRGGGACAACRRGCVRPVRGQLAQGAR